MSLQDDIEYLKARLFALEDRVKTSPHFRWGTVAQSVPLSIILDGAAGTLPGTPANAGPKLLLPGERVRVELQGNRAVVHAVGGRANGLRGTSAQRVALAMSGAAVQGMRFYDTDENREYIWRERWRPSFWAGTLTVSSGAMTQIGSTGVYASTLAIPGIPVDLVAGERLRVTLEESGLIWGGINQTGSLVGPHASPLSPSVRFFRIGGTSAASDITLMWEVLSV